VHPVGLDVAAAGSPASDPIPLGPVCDLNTE
jgi:hypothetical protein